MNIPTVWIPATLPPAFAGDKAQRVDLSPGSPVRQFIDEALVLGLRIEADPLLRNQFGGAA